MSYQPQYGTPNKTFKEDHEIADDGRRCGYSPEAWSPPPKVDHTVPGRDGVPTVDDDLDSDPDAAPRSYPAWDSKGSVVLSGPCGTYARVNPRAIGFHNNGPYYESRAEARREQEALHGAILEEYTLPHRWCFRFKLKENA